MPIHARPSSAAADEPAFHCPESPQNTGCSTPNFDHLNLVSVRNQPDPILLPSSLPLFFHLEKSRWSALLQLRQSWIPVWLGSDYSQRDAQRNSGEKKPAKESGTHYHRRSAQLEIYGRVHRFRVARQHHRPHQFAAYQQRIAREISCPDHPRKTGRSQNKAASPAIYVPAR